MTKNNNKLRNLCLFKCYFRHNIRFKRYFNDIIGGIFGSIFKIGPGEFSVDLQGFSQA